MPASRTVRRDVILRVPKVNVKAKHLTTTETEMGESSTPRRSMSPSKRTAVVVESASLKAIDAAKSDGGGEERYQHAAQATSAAEWNSLLIWARRQRGPQWDAATGIWQVDAGSAEYYSFCNDPARQTKLSTANEEDQNGADGIVKVTGEGKAPHVLAEDGDNESQVKGGYTVDDSPPIGPGGRRWRAR